MPTLGDYDLVGFQTGDDAFNFSRYLTRECGLHSRDFNFAVGDREVRVDAFPVGIETEHFARTARRAIKSSFVQNVVGSLNGRAQIIGVDRLDYSKGLNLRLDAYEHFLAQLRRLARQGDVSADHPEEPQRNPRIHPDGADGEPGGRAHQRQLWRGGLDADPLRQPRPTAAPRSPGSIARRASGW